MQCYESTLSTPGNATGYSQSQLMISRNIRANLPSLQSILRPKWPKRETVKERDNACRKTKLQSRKRGKSRELLKRLPRSSDHLMVETPSQTYKRNRKH